jgi:DNA-directed RNA polymerase subunit RPC12/RpoP
MMFTCRTCGFRYNIIIDYRFNKCILCGSVPNTLVKIESKVVELTNPYGEMSDHDSYVWY